MKKKLIPAIAAILAVGIVGLTACSANEKAQFGNYWEKNYTGVNSQSFQETLTYNVEYTPRTVLDSKNPTDVSVPDKDENIATSNLVPYTMSYTNGSFTTTFEARADKTYVYTSTLSIKVTYTYEGTSSEEFTDSVVSYVEFKGAQDGLVPISSTKTLLSHSPEKVTAPSTVADCYKEHHYKIATTYTDGKGECVVTQYPGVEGKEKILEVYSRSFNATSDKYDVLDNEQLLVAMRALPLSTSSVKIQTYSPFNLGFIRVKLTPSSEIKSANFKFSQKPVDFRKIEMVRDATNSGATQIALYAATKTPENNPNRNRLLLLLTPISYGFGSLAYTLTSVSETITP